MVVWITRVARSWSRPRHVRMFVVRRHRVGVYRRFLTPTPRPRYRWRVLNPELVVRGAAIAIGLLFGAIGTMVILATLGVFGHGAVSVDARWIGIVAGLAFILGGLGAIVTYGI